MKVVIVGAGVAGLGIGWRLAQAGMSVTILDRSQPGSGASWAAAGMLAPGAEIAHAEAEKLFSIYSSNLWSSFAMELERESGLSIGYRRSGTILLEPADSRPEAPDTAWMTPEEARARMPMLTGDIAGAWWLPEEALVDNRLMAKALVVAFLKVGGTLVSNEAVTGFESRGEQVIAVRTPFGLYDGDAFILAAGAWSGLLDAAMPVRPVKGEMIALASPKEKEVGGPMVWGHGIYAVPRGTRLLIGATVEDTGFDTRLTASAARWLKGQAEKLMPALSGWRISDHWAGLRPGTPDHLPLLGPSHREGLFMAGGQYRNGILFTPAMAEHLRDLLLGKAVVIPEFDPRRFGKTA